MLISLLSRFRSWWAVEDADERIEGSGEVHLDPAHNSQYTAERRLKQYAEMDEHDEDIPDRQS